MKTFRDDLTAEAVRSLLEYDPESGVFVWKTRPGCRTFNARFAGEQAGKLGANGRYIQIHGVKYAAHRLAWLYVTGGWPSGEVDHKNLRNDENWFDNLREATPSQNCANKRAYSTNRSGFKGVSVCSSTGRWKAQICVNGKVTYLGLFDDVRAAAEAYAAAADKHFGEFARAA